VICVVGRCPTFPSTRLDGQSGAETTALARQRVVQGGARKHAGADNHTLHGWKLEDKD
jgi:hypothetical protein